MATRMSRSTIGYLVIYCIAKFINDSTIRSFSSTMQHNRTFFTFKTGLN